ncbi:Ubx domain-containing protein [Dimargaris xerosporica]|nr:Ubx domain-containing protein [Dimargaris xerosporica]
MTSPSESTHSPGSSGPRRSSPNDGNASSPRSNGADNSTRTQGSIVYTMLLWPWKLTWRILHILFTYSVGLVAGPQGLLTGSTEPISSSPRLQAGRFIAEFERRNGSQRPPFFEGAYEQAVRHAKEDLKGLLVVLISEEHDDTPEFCRRIADEAFSTFLERQQLAIWGGNVRYSDAYQVSCTLQVSQFPFVGVVMPRSRNGGSMRMAVIERIEGLRPLEQVMAQILVKVQETNSALLSMRQARQERAATALLRQQQDEAYERSLRADQEKERRLREQREAEERKQQEIIRQQQEHQRLLALKAQYRQYLLATSAPEPPAGEPEVARFGIRFPDGQRVTRRFYGADPVEKIYQFVETYPLTSGAAKAMDAQGNAQSSASLPQRPNDYEHRFDFRLVAPMPRQVFDNQSLTIREAFKDHWPSTTLIVEPLDEV